MKIMVIGNFGSGWDGSICDELNISMALQKLGHEVIQVQRETFQVIKFPLDLDFVLVAQWSGYSEHFIRDLKKAVKCPVVYWAFDYHGFQPGKHLEMAKEADLFLSKEVGNRALYESVGCKFRWLSQDFAPDFLDKAPEQEKIYDAVFTGSFISRAEDRISILREIDKHLNLHIFGVTPDQWISAGFKNVHGPIMDEGLSKLYAQSKAVISVDWFTSCEGYWSDRNAQIMCCGATPIFKYIPMSEVAFKDNVDYFDTADEAIELIKNHKDRPESYEYAKKYLTATARVKDLLTIVKGEL